MRNGQQFTTDLEAKRVDDKRERLVGIVDRFSSHSIRHRSKVSR
jgi:hypothetical protein